MKLTPVAVVWIGLLFAPAAPVDAAPTPDYGYDAARLTADLARIMPTLEACHGYDSTVGSLRVTVDVERDGDVRTFMSPTNNGSFNTAMRMCVRGAIDEMTPSARPSTLLIFSVVLAFDAEHVRIEHASLIGTGE